MVSNDWNSLMDERILWHYGYRMRGWGGSMDECFGGDESSSHQACMAASKMLEARGTWPMDGGALVICHTSIRYLLQTGSTFYAHGPGSVRWDLVGESSAGGWAQSMHGPLRSRMSSEYAWSSPFTKHWNIYCYFVPKISDTRLFILIQAHLFPTPTTHFFPVSFWLTVVKSELQVWIPLKRAPINVSILETHMHACSIKNFTLCYFFLFQVFLDCKSKC